MILFVYLVCVSSCLFFFFFLFSIIFLFSSSCCHGLAAACDCGTPWFFHFTVLHMGFSWSCMYMYLLIFIILECVLPRIWEILWLFFLQYYGNNVTLICEYCEKKEILCLLPGLWDTCVRIHDIHSFGHTEGLLRSWDPTDPPPTHTHLPTPHPPPPFWFLLCFRNIQTRHWCINANSGIIWVEMWYYNAFSLNIWSVLDVSF